MKCKYCLEKEAKNKFCSRSHANKFNASKLSENRKGSNNPMHGKKSWNNKGGKIVLSGSRNVKYIEVYKNGKQIKKHRLIMEEHLGRELNKDEIVHHIDGNGLNNNISNLQVMHKSDHSRLHADVSYLNGGGAR